MPVQDIIGGPAKEDGRLRQGDQILIESVEPKFDGLGFVAARPHLDAARTLFVRLVVERRPRLVESNYAMSQETNSDEP
ncbi:hypothetical protein OS493_040154 [Desmophyllum pertusum]|uniref:PDZ domain-containing protein n=1 Tax=Desmophyllum pertusum TaxID=174260 RepID=A0A9W9Y6I3_9CNID|nr:hypothetical protein OS493_040154 [Desmophyllum pertusum]